MRKDFMRQMFDINDEKVNGTIPDIITNMFMHICEDSTFRANMPNNAGEPVRRYGYYECIINKEAFEEEIDDLEDMISEIMIHQPSTGMQGNASDIEITALAYGLVDEIL